MILYELFNTEDNSLYKALEIANGNRQYDFLRSIVTIALETGRPFLSQTIIKALNFHAIACLHTSAGEFRPCEVIVGDHRPPAFYRVQALMDDFINIVNHAWLQTDSVALAAYVLWRMNNIHPFINGNGRTARAACYFVLSVKAGGWIRGEPILPELIRQNREKYVEALQHAHLTYAAGTVDLQPLHFLLSQLLEQQLSGVPSSAFDPASEVSDTLDGPSEEGARGNNPAN